LKKQINDNERNLSKTRNISAKALNKKLLEINIIALIMQVDASGTGNQ